MNRANHRPVAFSLRLYRWLAGAFPQEFQNAYGKELVETGEDAVDWAWRKHGVIGLARLLADVAIRIPVEYASEFRRDIVYGVRMLAASPGFTAVALLSLGLGIGIATCSYSEMNGFVLRDLPGAERTEELVTLVMPTSYPHYKLFRDSGDLFSSTAAYVAPVPFGISYGGRLERSWGHLVTASYFSTLGVRPELGRFFDPGHDVPGQAPSVVVSYRFWENQLGSDPSAIGRTLRVNGRPATILGVGPKDFFGATPALFAADLWMPLNVEASAAPELADNALERRDLPMFRIIGRLKPGVTQERAEAELDATMRQFDKDFGEDDQAVKGRHVMLAMGGKSLVIRKQDLPFFTQFFMVMAGLVLLIACSNVANMMLARAVGRRREIAVRLALGASRWRLMRQLLTENLLLSAAAAIAGFVISVFIMRAASRMKMPFPMPVHFDLAPDWHALLFTAAVMLVTGLVFGMAPALEATRSDLTPALKEGGTVRLRRFRRVSLRNLLLLAQVGGSLALLLMLGMLSLGIQTTLGVTEGFDASNLYLVSIDPVRDGYSGAKAADFFEKLLERVKRLPALRSVCLTDTTPAAMNGGSVTFSSAGQGDAARVFGAGKYTVGRNYFETAGIPIRLGRAFRREDEQDQATPVIVTDELVREFWPGEDPVGRRIEIGNGEVSPPFSLVPGTFDHRRLVAGNGRKVFEVVGVAGDVREDLAAKKPHPTIYFPLRPSDYARPSLRGMTLMVRAAPGSDVLGAVRREVSAMDAGVTVFNARSMGQQVEEFMAPLRSAGWTYGVIGIFGLILASVGLAGVTAYSVAQRGHEIGIRMALGARARDVLGLVMKESAVLIALGTGLGLIGAWAGIRAMAGIFATVATTRASNPLLFVGAPLLLAGVALVACYLPARRSVRIDPAVALRQE